MRTAYAYLRTLYVHIHEMNNAAFVFRLFLFRLHMLGIRVNEVEDRKDQR